jgi:sarcosine oxidase subunit beta
MQNGTLVIGGAHLARLNFEKQSTEMDWVKLSESAQTVMALFPHLKNVRIVRAWAGMEGFMPDNLPIISPSSTEEGLYHAFGFSAHGFQLSTIVGEIIAELILDGKTRFPIEPFDIKRFATL